MQRTKDCKSILWGCMTFSESWIYLGVGAELGTKPPVHDSKLVKMESENQNSDLTFSIKNNLTKKSLILLYVPFGIP